MEAMPRRARLPRRGREALLLGAIPTAARDDVGTDHGPHGRGVPPRQARRRSRALVIQSQAHDGARAHAIEPSALRRLDAGADQAAGRRDRPQDLRAHRDHPARTDAPEAGLPRLGRHSAARQDLRSRAARSRLWPRTGDRCALLHVSHLDPEDQPRSQAARTRHGWAGDNAHQHPWPPLLPLRRRHAMLTHPTIDQLRALKLDGMADAFGDLQAQDRAKDLDHAEWLALLLDREVANGDGRFARLFRTLVNADLLILDDWGPDRLTANQRRDLMEIVEDRYGRGSTLITSQMPTAPWPEVTGEPTLA